MRGAGKFDKRVSVLEKTEEEQNEYGHFPENWRVAFSRWAEFQTAGGKEFRQQEQVQAEVSHRIVLRSDNQTRGITPKHRIGFNDRVFEITKSVDVNEGLQEVAVECKEVI